MHNNQYFLLKITMGKIVYFFPLETRDFFCGFRFDFLLVLENLKKQEGICRK